MNKKLTGKKILSSLLVLVLTLATVIGTNQLVKAEEEGKDPRPYEFSIEILEGWDNSTTVEYRLNSDDANNYKALSGEDWNPAFYILNLEDKTSFKKDGSDTLDIRISFNDEKKRLSEAKAISKDGSDESDILEDDSNNSEYIFEYRYTVDSEVTDNDIRSFLFWLCYPNSGRPEIVNEASRYIYAYDKTKDFDNSETPDKEDLKHALASELYDRFFAVKMFGDYGIKANDSSEFINELKSRIKISDKTGSVEAKTSSVATTIDTYTATVEWGLNEENGNELISNLTVYALPDDQSLLICTDFNAATGSGSSYYLRNTTSRNTTADDIIGFTQTNDSNPSDCGIIVTEDNLNVNTVVIGGHGVVTNIIDSTANYITMQVETMNDRHVLGAVSPCQVRVLNPSKKNFVAIHASGETKAVDGLTSNGFHPDTIYEAGSNSDKLAARIFIGDTTVNIGSLCPNTTGLSDDSIKITNVELANSKMKDGVTITKHTNSDENWWTNSWEVKFQSNFYDSVPLKLTYNGSSVKYITLQRIGLVVRYKYLMDPGIEQGNIGDTPGNIEYDCYGGTGPSFNYNYFNGEQIVIYATYYHPSNDPTGGNTDLNLIVKYGNGEKKVISSSDAAHNFSGYDSGRNNAVATTTFLIGFIPAKEKEDGNWSTPITSTNYNGGLHALVVNGGFNDKNSFGGAQIGNGLGVYWDGNITWDF